MSFKINGFNYDQDEEPSAVLTQIRQYLVNGPYEMAISAIITFSEPFVNNLLEVLIHDRELAETVLSIMREKYLSEWVAMLVKTIGSDDIPVRVYCIEELCSILKQNPQAMDSEATPENYETLARRVGDTEPAVYAKAMQIISLLDVSKCLHVIAPLKNVINDTNKTTMCNVFDVVTTMSIKSEECLKKCSEEGLINKMVEDLVNSTDILYKLNILELLRRIVVTPHGFSFFAEKELFERIADNVSQVSAHPMKSLLLPGYLKLFGSVAHQHPSVAVRYHASVVECLLDALESPDQSLLPVALDTLGHVGSTAEGKLCLAEIGERFQSAVTKVSEYIRNSPSNIKVRALSCMEGLISLENDPNYSPVTPTDVRVTVMTRRWFRGINAQANSMEGLYEKCKNPFPDIRLAAFGLLDAACQHQWGCEMVANTPGFIEYLLDRSDDHTKESKEAKYKVIKRLSLSPAFEPAVTIRMTEYLEQGVFYKESNLEVAMEEC